MKRDPLAPRDVASRPASPRLASTAGFTLIELMISLIILAIAILGMASVLIGTSEWQARSESQMEFVSAGEGKLEELRNVAARKLYPDTLQLLPGGSLTSNQAYHADSIQTPEGFWVVRRWQVASGPSSARTVTLRVIPREETDRSVIQREFTTIILMAP